MFWTPPSIPWLTLCLWFIWLGTASWNFLVTSSECQRKSLLEDVLCTFLPLAKGDRSGRPHTSYLNYVQRLLWDNEGAMQEQRSDCCICWWSSCMEKPCGRLLRSRWMMMMRRRVINSHNSGSCPSWPNPFSCTQ